MSLENQPRQFPLRHEPQARRASQPSQQWVSELWQQTTKPHQMPRPSFHQLCLPKYLQQSELIIKHSEEKIKQISYAKNVHNLKHVTSKCKLTELTSYSNILKTEMFSFLYYSNNCRCDT